MKYPDFRGVIPRARSNHTKSPLDYEPDDIKKVERLGVAYFLDTQILPQDIQGASREALVNIGFRFGQADDVFIQCQLPTGWDKVQLGESRHIGLRDRQGRLRASIFYKLTPCEKRASMKMLTRFSVQPCRQGASGRVLSVAVMDGDNPILEIGGWEEPDYERSEALEARGVAWLDEHHPDWRDPFAYWDCNDK
ncbi:hypothetical protein [Chromobacterium phragmitis]|uniref:hypothetical protein n=1 Tax=Chromobacterium phragmitis TaxID=2202141 RepID=UPI003878288D